MVMYGAIVSYLGVSTLPPDAHWPLLDIATLPPGAACPNVTVVQLFDNEY